MKILAKTWGKKEGFSLVELMVTVAIIGVLSAIAVPNFKKYQARAKTSEAKSNLAALYTAETSFFGDNSTYASCFDYMGVDLRGQSNNRYYAIGFAADAIGNLTIGAQTCVPITVMPAGKKVGAASAVAVTGGTLSPGTFTLEAAGIIDPASATDKWTMDYNGNMTNTVAGY